MERKLVTAAGLARSRLPALWAEKLDAKSFRLTPGLALQDGLSQCQPKQTLPQ